MGNACVGGGQHLLGISDSAHDVKLVLPPLARRFVEGERVLEMLDGYLRGTMFKMKQAEVVVGRGLLGFDVPCLFKVAQGLGVALEFHQRIAEV